MILLSDILGISALVDTINSRQAPGTTESSVLGPFHNHSHEFEHGASISSAGAGDSMLIRGSVKDIRGKPVAKALLDIWETNSNGKYDMQDDDVHGPDCRGKFYTDEHGQFYINGVKPVDYPVPFDGPVGIVLGMLDRNAYRPAHVVRPTPTQLGTARWKSPPFFFCLMLIWINEL
jgi:protocatechuate 3,4-dioxygenase beta subunit